MGHTTARAGDLESSSHPVAEAALLLAIASCPVLIVPFASHPFEPHKAAFLWMAAAAAGAAVLCSPGAAWRRVRELRRGPRLFLLGLACAVAGLCLSATFSEAPHLAWWGSALRRHGALTQVSLLAVIGVTLIITTGVATADRLLNAALIGSVGPTIYALAQALHLDPLTWELGRSQGNSTFGNWLFFAGYVATVWPLTFGRAVSTTRRARRQHWSWRSTTSAVAAWTLLALQTAALVLAGSRGPLLALVATGGLAAIVMLAQHGQRVVARLLAGLVFAATVAFLVVAPPRLSAPAAEGSATASMSNAERSTVVRLILWDAVGTGLRARAAADLHTALVGSGPESTTRLVTMHARPGLDHLLASSDIVPDRAHNDTLETLATSGLAGLVLQLVLMGTAVGLVLIGLGLLERSQVRAFALFASALLCGAAVLAICRGGGPGALALVVPAALVLSVTVWVMWRPPNGVPRDPERALLLTVAAAAALVHVIDLQLSVATIGSALTAAVGLGVALAMSVASTPRPAGIDARSRTEEPSLAMAVLVGWPAAVLTIGLGGTGLHGRLYTAGIASVAWALALPVIGGARRGVAASATTCAAVCALWFLWPPQAHATTRLPLLYLMAFACLIVVSMRLHAGLGGWRRPFAGLAVALVSGGLVAAVAMPMSSADVFGRDAMACAEQGEFDCASAQFHRALDEDPMNDQLLTQWAQVLMARSEALTGAAADAALADAGGALLRAQAIDPFNYQHPRNIAALERRRARRAPLAADRPAHLDDADRHYRTATALAPANGALWVEWANLDAERGRIDDAFAKLEHAIQLGATTEARQLADALRRLTGERAASRSAP